MMGDSITFADVRKLLVQLGFAALVNDQGNKVFKYPDTEVLIILPAYQPSEVLRPHHLDMVRHTLDFNGILSPAAFNGLAEKVPS
jgi:hypothetical protein